MRLPLTGPRLMSIAPTWSNTLLIIIKEEEEEEEEKEKIMIK
jgi:hypothetical protein